MKRKSYDVFISHASEDKRSFVEPLALELRKRGLNVWFDKFVLQVGDSLRASIELGLAKSRFGIVIFSPSFFKKKWPKAELNGLFSKEIAGKKKILPILHEYSVAKLRQRYPIQSDKLSLSSAMSMDYICDELIRVVKPELLLLDNLGNQNRETAEAFLHAAQTQHPGYEFTIETRTFTAEGKKPRQRIEINVANIALIKSLPTINVTFVGKGAEKISEFLRTGRAQTWTAEEFMDLQVDIPLFPATTKGSILSIGPCVGLSPRPVRVEISGDPKTTFQLMDLNLSRCGMEEGELTITYDREAIIIVITSYVRKTPNLEITLSWKFEGHSARQCLRALNAIDNFRSGGSITLIDLRDELPSIVLPMPEHAFEDPFQGRTRELLELCAKIEEHFSIQLEMGHDINESDAQALRALDCLLNGKDFHVEFSGSINLMKLDEKQTSLQLAILRGEGTLETRSPVDNFLGYFELFGTKIPVPLWGLQREVRVGTSWEEIQRFEKANTGEVFKFKILEVRPTKLIWMTNNNSLVWKPGSFS